jgi:hypothetical protein
VKLPNRSLAFRAAAVALLSTAVAVALAPTASAAERRPVDHVADVIAQVIYPNTEGMANDWTAEERIDGWLGYNSLPGGPLGHWGPGPEGVGYYGMVGAVIGGPPLPGNPNPVGGQRSPVADAVTAADELVFGPSEDYAGDAAAADDPLAEITDAVTDLIAGDENDHDSTTTQAPEQYTPPQDETTTQPWSPPPA